MLLILGVGNLKAQREDIMYFFKDVPQSFGLNPALMPTNNFYISGPLSGFAFEFGINGLCYHDAINSHPDYPDSLRFDVYGLSDRLKRNNHINIDVSEQILGFGFRTGKNYFSFDLSLSVNTKISFSKDLFDVLLYGTEVSDGELNLIDDHLLEATAWLSAGFGYAREINERLTVGGRFKLLFGLANIHTKIAQASCQTNGDYDMTLRTNLDVLACTPFGAVSCFVFPKENISDFQFTDPEELETSSILSNMGVAFDFGGAYRLNDYMEVSLAISDFGFINWKSDPRSIQTVNPNAEVRFEGVESSFDSLGTTLEDYINAVGDSLGSLYELQTVAVSSYKTWIPTKIKAGFTWNFAPWQYLHAIANMRIQNGSMRESRLGVFYGFRTRYFSASVGNSFKTYSAFNPSVMMSFALPGVNLYWGSSFNSAHSMSFNVADQSGVSVFFGLNLSFGKKPYLKPLTKIDDDESVYLYR